MPIPIPDPEFAEAYIPKGELPVKTVARLGRAIVSGDANHTQAISVLMAVTPEDPINKSQATGFVDSLIHRRLNLEEFLLATGVAASRDGGQIAARGVEALVRTFRPGTQIAYYECPAKIIEDLDIGTYRRPLLTDYVENKPGDIGTVEMDSNVAAQSCIVVISSNRGGDSPDDPTIHDTARSVGVYLGTTFAQAQAAVTARFDSVRAAQMLDQGWVIAES